MNNITKFNKLSQRQKKYAKTKVALLNALLDELELKPLAAILIKDLALAAEVSEPTFFNYFNSKQHILLYFIQLWSIEMNALALSCEESSSSYLEVIEDIFTQTAEEISAHPQIMIEIIAFQSQGITLEKHEITHAEKWLFFKDIQGIENIEGAGLETILPPLLNKAVTAGELQKDTDIELLFLTLSSVFFGTSLLLLKDNPEQLASLLKAELNLILSGVRHKN